MKGLAALLVAVALVASAAPSFAATKMAWSITQSADSMHRGNGCTATGQVYVREYGKSGVTRFRTRWELRGPYDPGYLPTYAKTGYTRSGAFPNDQRSFGSYFTLPGGYINFAQGKEYALWARMVGERPSFWQRDIVRKGALGPVACEVRVGAVPYEPTGG